jgi:hypothetical protein
LGGPCSGRSRGRIRVGGVLVDRRGDQAVADGQGADQGGQGTGGADLREAHDRGVHDHADPGRGVRDGQLGVLYGLARGGHGELREPRRTPYAPGVEQIARTRSAEASNLVIGPMPDRPEVSASQVAPALSAGSGPGIRGVLCGTDAHDLNGMALPPGVAYPVVPGHKVAGTVAEGAPEEYANGLFTAP